MTKMWLRLGFLACVGAAFVGCGGDDEDIGTALQPGVHIWNPGYLAMPLTKPGDTASSAISLFNMGNQHLIISGVSLTGQNANMFTIDQPTSMDVKSRDATAIPVTFKPDKEGAYVANVHIASNDSDFPDFVVDVLGPSGDNSSTSPPKLYAADTTVLANQDDGHGESRGVLRYYNVGAQSLIVTGYAFADSTNFSLANGTPIPGGACTADDPKCGDSLFCLLPTPLPSADASGTCALSVPTANPIVLDIYYSGTGEKSTTFTITAQGSPTPMTAVVTVNGSR